MYKALLFATPVLPDGTIDIRSMLQVEMPDPADNTQKVPYLNHDDKMLILRGIVYFKSDFMKDNMKARDALTESGITW